MRTWPHLLRIALHLGQGALQAGVLFHLINAPSRQHRKRAWSRQLVALLGIRIECDESGLAAIDGGLLVGNHISFVDIYVINALLPSTFVAKSEVARWPLIGWLSRRVGTVFIERGNRKAAQHTSEQIRQALDAGQRIAIFPEGTTTVGNRVLPFHAALFQSAIDASVPVHAIALSYHDDQGAPSNAAAYIDDISLLDCLTRILRSRGLSVRVAHAASFLPPLPARRHLAHRAHQAIASRLSPPDGRTASTVQQTTVDRWNRGGISS